MNISIKLSRYVIGNILIFSLLALSLLKYTMGGSIYNFIYAAVLGGGVLLVGASLSMFYKPLPVATLCLLLLAISFNVLKRANGYDVSLFGSVTLFFTAWLGYGVVYKRRCDLLPAAKVMLFIFYFYFIYKALTNGYSPSEINNYFPDASRNIVSAVCIFLQLFYSGTYFLKYNKLPKLTPFITLLLCIFSYGRSGIALSFGIVILTWLHYLSSIPKRPIYLLLTGIGVLCFSLAILWSGIIGETLEKSNFAKRGLESPRYSMVEEYFSHMTAKDVLIGRSYDDTPTITAYNSNPHNSFIQGHHEMGAPYAAWVLLILISLAWAAITKPKTIWLVGLCLIFLVRISVDKLSLPGLYSFIFLYLYFASLRLNRVKEHS